MNPTRLFDCIQYQLNNFPKPDMLCAKEKGSWRKYSTQESATTINKLTAGLLKLGVSANDGTVEQADKIAIISNNRPEWVFTDLAVQKAGAILIPLYPTTNALEIKFILNDAAVKYIFVSNFDLYEKITAVAPDVPSLKNIYTFDNIDGASHWTEILTLADDATLEQVKKVSDLVNEEQVATIIYTSGTTGIPKGVMLTHKNIMTNAMLSKQSFPFPDDPSQKVLSFLPLNHIFEKCVTYIYLYSGISIYYAESMETIGDNLKEIQPDGFTTVPRLLEKVFEKVMATGNSLTGIKRKLFFWALELGEQYDNRKSGGLLYDTQLALANKIVFSKWREGLGGNIKFIITGGAACSAKLLRIFNAGGIPVYEGYGPTENSPVICVNRKAPEGLTKFGTVGPPIDGVEVKLADDGEIMVKGPCVMKGYYKRPDLTAETIVEGWLLTGDIGEWDEGKFIKITDRKKELFKTSGGKYVAPQPIENKLKESPYVEQVMVVGAERKFVGALIVPSFTMLRDFLHHQHIHVQTNEEAIAHPSVQKHFRELVDSFNVFFNQVEQIKQFELLPKEWSVDGGEMTPKLSLKRKVVSEKYKDAIERIYTKPH